ncbi:hypothetical protein BDV95DRAFT_98833 [Massariosphaeria phaeospora]|uniref:Uncharacterized protein n=1 Tax=Massariosphaeria phaeospora TaxID=100035 RepID=A0A7C8IC18_9PLEO|nr:hypothetical protein BDV95DRAFT_98833 [Massariosphaeria phaeospora]
MPISPDRPSGPHNSSNCKACRSLEHAAQLPGRQLLRASVRPPSPAPPLHPQGVTNKHSQRQLPRPHPRPCAYHYATVHRRRRLKPSSSRVASLDPPTNSRSLPSRMAASREPPRVPQLLRPPASTKHSALCPRCVPSRGCTLPELMARQATLAAVGNRCLHERVPSIDCGLLP